jgi:nitroreductase
MCGTDCLDLIKTRRSIRKFENTPIPETDIQRIIEIGVSAPSAGNCQPWRIVVVTDKSIKERLARGAFDQKFIATAPVILAVCGMPAESAQRYKERGTSLYVFQDTAALTENMLLAAHVMGYGACWIGAFDDAEIARVLNVPPDMRPLVMIPIGVPARPIPEKRQRRPLAEVVVRESFGR